MIFRTRIHQPSGRSCRGAVLLVVLVLMVVLSAVLVQFIERALAEISAEGHYSRRDRLRVEAYSALEVTMGVLADHLAIEGSLSHPAQGWGQPLEVAGYEPPEGVNVSVSFVDESGKLSLASIDEGTLYLLFNAMGFAVDEALTLTNSLLDWMDPDDDTRIDGAESDLYSAAEWPYLASNRPIRRLSELAVIEGFRELFFDEFGRPNEYYWMFADSVTVYASRSLNANSVRDLVLRAAAGLGDLEVQALHDYLAGADGILGTADDRYFADTGELSRVFPHLPEGVQLGVTTNLLRVRVDVTEGSADSGFALEAVVRPGQGGTGTTGLNGRRNTAPDASGRRRSATDAQVRYPFVFLELREDVGQNGSGADPLELAADQPGAARVTRNLPNQ